MSVFPLLLIFAACMLLQALFAGYESGFVSINAIRVRYLAENEQLSRAQRLLRALQAPDRMLTMLLIGTNLMVVVGTLVVSLVVEQLLNMETQHARLVQDIVSTAIVAPVMLVFAEIIPKSVFRAHPTRLALAFQPLIGFFQTLFAPLTVPVSFASTSLLRLFGGQDSHLSPLLSSLEEFRALVDEGVDHGTIEPEEQEMIHSVIDMQSTTAKEIMVPRIAICALPESTTRSELVQAFADSGHTRIPIYRESMDEIIGVVNAYSVLMDDESEKESIARLQKDVMHVPDTMAVDDLFREMKQEHQHIAIVVDEYGGTDGLITIEDILEEIFGEIQDEYDHEESAIHKVGPNAYTVDARVSLEDVSEALGLEIHAEDVETLGGWMMLVAGHIPPQGEVVEHGRIRMTVLVGGPNHISRIRVEVLPGDEASEA
ncbi:MAG: DUF21 domain-containing protein [Nitrospiraceae bacterium]|nr:DUF21 domain-containing protein [Nitrospiraceae bacterium]